MSTRSHAALALLIGAGTAACSTSRPAKTADSAAAAPSPAAAESAAPAPPSLPVAAPASPGDSAKPVATSSEPKGRDVVKTKGASDSSAAPTPSVAPSATVITGKVVAGGVAAAPTTSLQIEGGKPTTLVGPLESELRHLGGATIWATGAPVAGPNATFSVTRYEIVSIDGAKPVVGRVVTRNGSTWVVTDRDTVRLISAPADLTNKPGAKVWVVGRRAGNDLTTQTFGVIREP